MVNLIEKLQEWYASQCEADDTVGKTPWQHRYGLSIYTLDNPAWNVGIDLAGTSLSGVTMEAINIDNSEDDWLICSIHDDRFGAVGDPSKLAAILELFFQLEPVPKE